MRVKIPSEKSNHGFFSGLRPHLEKLPGVEKIEANPVTGSVLLVFSNEMDPQEIAGYAEANGLFSLNPTASNPPPVLASQVVDGFNELDAKVRSLTEGTVDLAAIAFLGLFGTGLYQMSIGEFAAPAWYTAFWYATSILLKSHGGGGKEPRPT